MSMFLVACSDDDPKTDPCEAVTCASGETCVDGKCVAETTECEACGTYEGTVDSDGDSVTVLLAPGVGLENEVLAATPFAAVITENATSSDSLDMDVSLEVNISGLPAKVPLVITVHYDATTGAFTAQPNRNYNIKITDPIAIDVKAKVVSFSGLRTSAGNISGSLVLDDQDDATADNIDATFVFTADVK